MKKTIILFLAALCLIPALADKTPRSLGHWDVPDAKITKKGDSLKITFKIDLSVMDVPSEEAVLFTPVLKSVATNDSVTMPAVGVYGRNRYFHYQRQDIGMLSGPDELVMKNKDKPETLVYSRKIGYRDWMSGTRLVLHADCYGCCFTVLGHEQKSLGDFYQLTPKSLIPTYVAATTVDTVKGKLHGSALIQFVVDKTNVKPDFRDNYRELGKITHSIDTVKADRDLTITKVTLKGFASPESPYKHNTELSIGRTENVKKYVQNLYQFPEGLIQTAYEPEDWAGLRRYVENSNIDNRQSILEIIDENFDHTKPTYEQTDKVDFDKKEEKLRAAFPKQYDFLLNIAYPPLRHTEYTIEYYVQRAANLDEIRRRFAHEPAKLSLNEFYLLANTYEPGTDEFMRVYDLCARIYPKDKVANLNAANAAMQMGNLDEAEKFLNKAGNTPEADLSRGILYIHRKQYAKALPLIEAAEKAGLDNATTVLMLLKTTMANQEE